MNHNFLKVYILIVGCFLALSVSAQSVYYVSSSGTSQGDGSFSHPFLSVHDAIEQSRADTGSVTIYIREGIYRLDKTLVLTSEDGNENKNLVIKAYPGEKAVISGGIPLELEWEPFRDGIMKAKVKGAPVMDLLLANGVIRNMARFPNYDTEAVRYNGTSALATSPQRIKRWKNPEGGYLHAMHKHDWGDFHYRILGKNKKGELELEGGWQNNRQMGIHEDNRMVENIFEELDDPGEWYYDKKDKWLYYYPLPGEEIKNLLLESAQLKHLIEFQGTETNPVKNISIEGLEFTQTVRTFMEKNYEPLLRSDWTIYRGGAVVFRGTENCSLVNCSLYNLGGNGIFFDCYNRHSEVSGSHFTLIGASAICFVGDPEGVRSPSFEYNEFVPLEKMDDTKGPKNNNYPAYCKVYDNLIHHIGLFEKQITGVELSMCRNILVSHNSIYDTPRAGINVSEGTWGGHIIEYNDIFDTVKETGDHGSLNSWGRDRFWHPDYTVMSEIVNKNKALILADVLEPVVIRHNRLRCDRGWDIDLDDGSTNYQIYNNLCLNGGIKLREGFYRVVENNILVNNTFHPHVWFKNSGDIFTRNIVMTPYSPINLNDWGKMVDYNIFTDSLAYQAARNRNTDNHSIVTSVQFTDPSQGDFSISDDSEAVVEGGFRNFSMKDFGVVSPRLKQIAKRPVMPVPVTTVGSANKNVINWKGITIKNLETLGERSATGMDAERGVYVISVDALGSRLKDYILPNDVILGIGGISVDDLVEMEEALKQIDRKNPVEMLLFRDQKELKVILKGDLL